MPMRSEERFTQAQLRAWIDARPPRDIGRYELLRGQIVMSPPALPRHGRVEVSIASLLDRHGWTDQEYAAGRAVFTEQELVELVTVVGYYCQISLTLNAFRVALPPGSADPFP